MFALIFLALFAFVNSETCKSDRGVYGVFFAVLKTPVIEEPESTRQLEALEEWFSSNNQSGNKFLAFVKSFWTDTPVSKEETTAQKGEWSIYSYFVNKSHSQNESFMAKEPNVVKLLAELFYGERQSEKHNLQILVFVTNGINPKDNQSTSEVISQMKKDGVYIMTIYIGNNYYQWRWTKQLASNDSLAFQFEPYSEETSSRHEIVDAFCEIPALQEPENEKMALEMEKTGSPLWVILFLVAVLAIVLIINGVLAMILKRDQIRKRDTWDVPEKKNKK